MFKRTSLTTIVDDHITPCEFESDGYGLCVTVAHVFHSVKQKEQFLSLLKAADLDNFTHNTWCHSALMVSKKVPRDHLLTVAAYDGELNLTKFNNLVKRALKNKEYAGPEGRARLVRVP